MIQASNCYSNILFQNLTNWTPGTNYGFEH